MAAETDNVPTALSLNAFTRSGYAFTGWNTTATGTGSAYGDGATYPFTQSATLYAQWAADTSYTVTFNANGGSGTMAAETDNVPTALSLNAFTRSGYAFTGWNTTASGTGSAYGDGATYPFTQSATLYAQWAADTSYTVTFNANGGSGTMAAETDNVPTALTLNAFTRSGYYLHGLEHHRHRHGQRLRRRGHLPVHPKRHPLCPVGGRHLLHRDLQRQRRVRDHGRRDRQRPDGADPQRLYPFRLYLHGLEHHRQRHGQRLRRRGHLPVHPERHPLCPVGGRHLLHRDLQRQRRVRDHGRRRPTTSRRR